MHRRIWQDNLLSHEPCVTATIRSDTECAFTELQAYSLGSAQCVDQVGRTEIEVERLGCSALV